MSLTTTLVKRVGGGERNLFCELEQSVLARRTIQESGKVQVGVCKRLFMQRHIIRSVWSLPPVFKITPFTESWLHPLRLKCVQLRDVIEVNSYVM